ncbi:carboxymuconolactone decarboxylase family protein [Elstera cyanobacteriorum]|uniref:Alkylhydroperoxidase n=1 Tax=Elstera cyanobacteriorum TaxID=2022747 RepID=A0A255XIW2_9PROT|nr:carboxymuconolactone decarboxylase family protein [Elstera cyanobacteriorum]MCK6443018.1 carboxymuconolactone decarboxylase family protein [Elstera cyanobacteriorum]OYQ16878.1 alkylhydroperoxidase [Elstera cyanobacteriorum]GFZ89202.1 alkyl hydroperoxide reductase AhpD [Elstera cyanobacteriorum]
MSHIPTPASLDAAPAASQPLLSKVQAQLGSLPNFFRLLATSPAALTGYLDLGAALSQGELDLKTRERIALAVSKANSCDYCGAAHGYLATHLAKLDAAEIRANRAGGSTDTKADAAVRFATEVARSQGRIDPATLTAARAAGFSDAALIEIVGVVTHVTFSNLINNAFDTEIDFPLAA